MQYIKCMVLVAALALPGIAQAARSGESAASEEIARLQHMLEDMRTEYEERISALETRLAQTERAADRAFEIAEDTAISAGSRQSAPNAFNPAIGAVLVGRHSDLDNNWDAIPGFATDGELGPGDAGFSLGESELNLKAAIDASFYGNLTLALEDEDGDTEIAVEEAWIQTLGLPLGLTTTVGRHFSGIGYLNGFHRHADDFSDRPLPYQAFLGGQYIGDGAQLRWLAPTALFLEVGAELNWSNRFPATGGGSSPDAWSLFAHVGDDLGSSHSWQLGLSYLDLDVDERGAGDEEMGGSFTGDSDMIGIDAVWKWAPDGNPSVRNFKLQGEYFYREEDGLFGDTVYDGDQRGWYVQGLWQFMPRWRAGYRHDEVDSDNGSGLIGTALEDPSQKPKRDSLMIDWSPSEFSRLRLQYVYDQVLQNSDNQLVMQYIMSLGAHGAHQF